ncbi:unnamed protein product [Caenorhabditis bovis]|uniref:non-specific serine/threonine protein kinase n=1 Tax=Caenorhabditis bovis TaxID=2654633 RepID=A0A8S1EZJ2_9PELO|nr:unnamed protein product [Caenorhabditis bovis]
MSKQIDDDKSKRKAKKAAGAVPNQMQNEKMLLPGHVLLNRFEVQEMIGGGGFAQIFLAIDKQTKAECAVKIEDAKQDIRRMKLEITVLLALRGNLGIPEVMGMGKTKTPNAHFCVMQLVGKNLSDIRRKLPARCFSHKTLYRAMIQIAKALSIVHGAGFLHRDLKPSNCCIGHVDVTRIYLIDYGLTRQYLDKGGIVRKPRVGVGLRGTIRYMSLDGHARRDLGPNNDLVAFLYTTIELGDGTLPWTYERDADEIVKLKQAYIGEKLCAKQPKMTKVAEYIESLNYHSIPDYEKLIGMLEECNPSDLKPDEPYDWQFAKNECSVQKDNNILNNESEEKAIQATQNI